MGLSWFNMERVLCVQRWLAQLLALAGMAVLVVVMFYTVISVILRYLGATPLPGVVDVVSYGLAICVAASMPYGFMADKHVSVSVLLDALRGYPNKLVVAIASTISAGFMILLARGTWLYAGERLATQDTMWILGFKVWPFWYAVAVLFSLATVAAVSLSCLGIFSLFARQNREAGAR